MNIFLRSFVAKIRLAMKYLVQRYNNYFISPSFLRIFFYPTCPTFSLCPMFHARFLYLYAMSNVIRLS